jgi:hypothetical protein
MQLLRYSTKPAALPVRVLVNNLPYVRERRASQDLAERTGSDHKLDGRTGVPSEEHLMKEWRRALP